MSAIEVLTKLRDEQLEKLDAIHTDVDDTSRELAGYQAEADAVAATVAELNEALAALNNPTPKKAPAKRAAKKTTARSK